MTTYATLKTVFQTIYGAYVGAGNFIESDSGTPTELAILLNLVHNRIMSAPNKWPFAIETADITATGSTTYDLNTLLPGFRSIHQVYGIDTNAESEYFGNSQANITDREGWTIKNGQLIFTGTTPTSGTTFKVQYQSSYMVKDSSGVRKQYFTADDDVSVLNVADENVLFFGVGEFVQWKTDEVSRDKRREVKLWFSEAWENLRLRREVDVPVKSML